MAAKWNELWATFSVQDHEASRSAAGRDPSCGARALGAAVSIGDFLCDKAKPSAAADDATPIAALILDSQKKLKLTVTGERKLSRWRAPGPSR